MSKANPKAWFTSPIAKITYRSVDKWAKYQQSFRPFFPTWEEAKGWMVEKASERVRKAEKELKSARAHLAKVTNIQHPDEEVL